MVRGEGLEPSSPIEPQILSLLRIPIPPSALGGAYGYRPRLPAFAELCLTSRPTHRINGCLLFSLGLELNLQNQQ